MTSNDATFAGKVYLMKMKAIDDYNGEDILVAICQVGKDNVDFEDFKSIVTVLNEKGLWTPILSTERISWKALKNDVDCKALNFVGAPILLLEGVHTFKEILSFSYDQGLLNHPKGKEILDKKIEASKEMLKKPRQSTTLEAARKDKGKGKKSAKKDGEGSAAAMVGNVVRMSADMQEQLEVNRGLVPLSSSEEQLTGVAGLRNFGLHGNLDLPTPVPVTQSPGAMDISAGHQVLVTSAATIGSDTLDFVPAGTSSASADYLGHQVYTTYDIIGITSGHTASGGDGHDLVEASLEAARVQVGDVVEETPAPAPGATHGTNAGFDPTNFNIDAIDNEMEVLETSTEMDLAAKLSRSQSLAKTLRKSLEFACTTNQNLMRVADANDMKLRECRSYSASDVLDGLRPTMATVGSLGKKLDAVMEVVRGLEMKFDTGMKSLHDELVDLAASVANYDELAVARSNNVINHLSSVGLISVGSTFDIPSALQSITRMLSDEIVPVFTSGRVQPVYDANAAVAATAAAGVGQHMAAGFNQTASTGTVPVVPQDTPVVLATKRHQDGSAKVADATIAARARVDPSTLCTVATVDPAFNARAGLLPTPVQYQHVERNYLRVNTSHNASLSGFTQQSPAQVTPQKMVAPGQQLSGFSAPPPPAKKAKDDGSLSGTSAVRSMFQPYNQITPGASTTNSGYPHHLIPSTAAQGYSAHAPANYQSHATLQNGHFYSRPPPYDNAATTVIQPTHGMYQSVLHPPGSVDYNPALAGGNYYVGPQQMYKRR